MSPKSATVIAILTSLFVIEAAAQNPLLVNRLGDESRWDIRGATTFPADKVRAALASDFDVLLAAHPSAPVREFPAVLERRTVDGYLHAGFPDAKAAVTIDGEAGRVTLSIDEGRRYLAGRLSVVGAKQITADRLAAWLTEKQPPADAIAVAVGERAGQPQFKWVDRDGKNVEFVSPIWLPGKPAPFDSQTRQRLGHSAKQGLAELGFASAEFTLNVVPHDDGTAELVVAIKKEGNPDTIRAIELAGNVKNSDDEIVRWLGLQPGEFLTRERRTRVLHQLWQSGRFLSFQVDVNRTDAEQGVDLRIEVVEYEHAPKLFEQLSREEEALLRFRDWLARSESRSGDLVIRPVPDDGSFELVLAGRGVLLQFGRAGSNANRAPFDHAVVLAEGVIGCYSLAAGRAFSVPLTTTRISVPVQFSIREDGGKRKFGWGFSPSVSSSTADNADVAAVTMNLDPVAFIALAHEANARPNWQDEILTVSTESRITRFNGTTGRLVDSRPTNADATSDFQVVVQDDRFDKRLADLQAATANMPNEFIAVRPISSSLAFFCREDLLRIVEAKLRKPDADAAERERWLAETARKLKAVRALLDHGALQPIDDSFANDDEDSDSKDKFKLPANVPDFQGLNAQTLPLFAAHVLVPLASRSFPRDSWPWIVGRETGFYLAGAGKYTSIELQRLYGSLDCGPLGHLATASLLAQIRAEQPRQLFAARGLQRLVLDDFRRDYRSFLEAETPSGKFLRHVATVLREINDDDAIALGEMVFDDPTPFVAFARSLRTAPESSIDEALPSALDQLWEDGLRDRVGQALRSCLP